MRSQYAIGYTSTNPKKDGGYRKIDIKVAEKDYKVQARKGLLRDRARELVAYRGGLVAHCTRACRVETSSRHLLWDWKQTPWRRHECVRHM